MKPKVGGGTLLGLVGMGVHPLVIMVDFNISMWVPSSYQVST